MIFLPVHNYTRLVDFYRDTQRKIMSVSFSVHHNARDLSILTSLVHVTEKLAEH